MKDTPLAFRGGSPGFSIRESTDLDHYLSLQPGDWDMKITQLAGGTFSSQLRIVGFEGLVIYQNLWGKACVVQGQSPKGWMMFGGIVNPHEAPVSWCGAPVGRRHFAATAGGEEVDFWVADNSSDIVLLIEPSLLRQIFGDTAEYDATRRKHLDFGNAGSKLIDVVISALKKIESEPELLQRPAIMAQMRSNLLRVLEDCLPTFDSHLGADINCTRVELVHRVVQHVAQANNRTCALGMAQAVGVSQKTLEMAFREVMDTTPGKYLMLTRLNGARHALAHADKESTTVTDVAMDLGFTHPGRFSKAYKDLFGELPSDTLARRA